MKNLIVCFVILNIFLNGFSQGIPTYHFPNDTSFKFQAWKDDYSRKIVFEQIDEERNVKFRKEFPYNKKGELLGKPSFFKDQVGFFYLNKKKLEKFVINKNGEVLLNETIEKFQNYMECDQTGYILIQKDKIANSENNSHATLTFHNLFNGNEKDVTLNLEKNSYFIENYQLGNHNVLLFKQSKKPYSHRFFGVDIKAKKIYDNTPSIIDNIYSQVQYSSAAMDSNNFIIPVYTEINKGYLFKYNFNQSKEQLISLQKNFGNKMIGKVKPSIINDRIYVGGFYFSHTLNASKLFRDVEQSGYFVGVFDLNKGKQINSDKVYYPLYPEETPDLDFKFKYNWNSKLKYGYFEEISVEDNKIKFVISYIKAYYESTYSANPETGVTTTSKLIIETLKGSDFLYYRPDLKNKVSSEFKKDYQPLYEPKIRSPFIPFTD